MDGPPVKILVVGAGGVGGYFGGRLLQAGRDVTFLVRDGRPRPLDITSPHGDYTLSPMPSITADRIDAAYDLIVVTPKAQDLAAAIDGFAPAVGPRTAILPLLNGMRHLDALDARFGAERVLGGCCHISSVRTAGGAIAHLNPIHRLIFGERDCPRSPRVDAIEAALSGARFESRPSVDILRDMWEKWILITAAAGITCLMRASIADIVAAGAAEYAERMLEECAAIARSVGFAPSVEHLAYCRGLLTTPGLNFTTSMLRDIEAGAPIEAEHVVGDLLARRATPAPFLEIAYAHLRCYAIRAAGPSSRA